MRSFNGRRKSRGIRRSRAFKIRSRAFKIRSRAFKIRKRPGAVSHSHIFISEITRRLARCKRQTYAPIIAERRSTVPFIRKRDRHRRRCDIAVPLERRRF